MTSVARRIASDLFAELDALRATQAELQQRIAQIEARQPRRGPRDDDDLRVFRSLVLALDTPHGVGLSRVRFTARAVVDYARLDRDLLAILQRADCTTARSLGKLFGRCEQQIIDGHVLVRVALTNEGWAWKFLPA